MKLEHGTRAGQKVTANQEIYVTTEKIYEKKTRGRVKKPWHIFFNDFAP